MTHKQCERACVLACLCALQALKCMCVYVRASHPAQACVVIDEDKGVSEYVRHPSMETVIARVDGSHSSHHPHDWGLTPPLPLGSGTQPRDPGPSLGSSISRAQRGAQPGGNSLTL